MHVMYTCWKKIYIMILNKKFIFNVSMKENIFHKSLIDKIVPLIVVSIFLILET